MARRSLVIAGLVAFMINLVLFVYIPIMHRAANLHAVTYPNTLSDHHISGASPELQLQRQPKEDVTATPVENEIQTENKLPQKTMNPKDVDVVEEMFVLETFQNALPQYNKVYDGPLTQANQMEHVNKTKIVGFISGSYAKIAMRWYDRLETLGYTNHWIICTDEASFQSFQTKFSKYRVEASYLPSFPELYAGLRYGRKQRHRVKMLFAHRWVYMLEQLKLGNHILVTDVDNIFSSYYDMKTLELSEYDMYNALETRHPQDVWDYQGFVFCGGMGWFRASPPTIRFIDQVVTRCGIECDDQVLLNRIIAYNQKVEWNRSGDGHADVTEHNEDTKEKVFFNDHFERIVGLVTTGFTGYSKAMGIKIKVWDRDFAYRGKNDPSECPENNWVSMPFVVFVSRWEGPKAKLNSYDLWDEQCPSPYTALIGGQEKKSYKDIKGI